MVFRLATAKNFCLYLLFGLALQLQGVAHAIPMARLASITPQEKIAADRPQIAQASALQALNPESTPIKWSTFSSDIDKFASVMRKQLHTEGAWVSSYKPDQQRFDVQQPVAFKPYVQKMCRSLMCQQEVR